MGRSIILTDGEVALAVPEEDDFKKEHVNDPIIRTFAYRPDYVEISDEKLREIWMKQDFTVKTFSILHKGKFVGMLGFRLHNPIPDMWFELYADRYQGIGTRAIKLGLLFEFLLAGEKAIYAITNEANIPAIRAMEKAGFKKFGKTKYTFKIGKKYHGAFWMVAYADRWLRENEDYVKEVLDRSGYPVELFL